LDTEDATVIIQVASKISRYGHRNSTLEHWFQHKPVSPPIQIQNVYPSQPEPNNTWTKVSHKRGRPTHEDEEAQREAKEIKESEYLLHPTPTSNRYSA
jgi:hypothetical protein